MREFTVYYTAKPGLVGSSKSPQSGGVLGPIKEALDFVSTTLFRSLGSISIYLFRNPWDIEG